MKSKVATFLNYHIERSDKPQKQIAEEAGFDRPNIISMLKTGQTKLPLTRVASMAAALEVDPKALFLLCIQEYMPELHEVIQDILGSATPITANERKILDVIRAASSHSDPGVNGSTKPFLEKFAKS